MKYYLIENDYPIFELDITSLTDGLNEETKCAANFRLYWASSWNSEDNSIYEKHFISEVYFKWDWCTHWNFNGMDYDPTDEEPDKDSYYHICGSYSMNQWIKMFAFVRTVMLEVLGDRTGEYTEEHKQLDKIILKDCQIKKVE